jgi:hypothetical protein
MREATSKRTWASCAFLALAGCSSANVIDAGTNEGGPGASSSGGAACPTGDVCTPAQTPGVTTIANQIQEIPTNMVSDGTWLYWTSSQGPGGPVGRVPVGGGAVTTVVAAPVSGGFIAVDDTNVYFPGAAGGLSSAPKGGGGTPAPVTGISTTSSSAFTVVGAEVYWTEHAGSFPSLTATIKHMPLKGGSVSVVASVELQGGWDRLGVTASTVFVNASQALEFFPLTGIPAGGMPNSVMGLPSPACESFLVSDTSAVYCGTRGSVVQVANDGTTTTLGPLLIQGLTGTGLGFDDANVYWADETTVGTIMKVSKTGGTATVVARDTSPVALAVDAHAIYWSDAAGNIMKLAK